MIYSGGNDVFFQNKFITAILLLCSQILILYRMRYNNFEIIEFDRKPRTHTYNLSAGKAHLPIE